jgi:hypothetical protein
VILKPFGFSDIVFAIITGRSPISLFLKYLAVGEVFQKNITALAISLAEGEYNFKDKFP